MTIVNGKEEIREDELKAYTLRSKHMFPELNKDEESTVIFEKRLSMSKSDNAPNVIADALIFNESGNILGVEYKSETDSTKRLNKQLRAYSLVCNYVYVFVHDKHVPKTEEIIKRYNHQHVGIIAYIDFKGQITAGVYKRASRSPYQSAYHALNLLWKSEILTVLGTLRYPERHVDEIGLSNMTPKANEGSLVGSGYWGRTYDGNMKKNQLIRNFIKWFGEEEAMKVLCDIFINNKMHPTRSIKLRHFINKEIPHVEEE